MTSPMNFWDEKFQDSISSRGFNAGEGVVMICNNRCRFRISPTRNNQFYIQGLAVWTKNGVLHINPTVNIDKPSSLSNFAETTKRPTESKQGKPEQFNLFYTGGFGGGADEKPYQLIDIMIQAPSKTSIKGQRYPMEVCMVHQSADKKRFVVSCVPMEIMSDDTPEPTQKGLYDILMALAKDFPANNQKKEEEKAYSVHDAPPWSPWMFLPRPDKQSFFNWLDPKSNGTVSYILFYNPEGLLQAPKEFYKQFLSHLVKGRDLHAKERVMEQKIKEILPSAPKDLWMYINENIPSQPIETRFKCKEYTVPALQETVEKAKEALATPEKTPEKAKKKFPYWILSLGIVGALVLIGFMYYYFIYRKKSRPSTLISNNNSNFNNLGNYNNRGY